MWVRLLLGNRLWMSEPLVGGAVVDGILVREDLEMVEDSGITVSEHIRFWLLNVGNHRS